jgi:hypothetical protein
VKPKRKPVGVVFLSQSVCVSTPIKNTNTLRQGINLVIQEMTFSEKEHSPVVESPRHATPAPIAAGNWHHEPGSSSDGENLEKSCEAEGSLRTEQAVSGTRRSSRRANRKWKELT